MCDVSLCTLSPGFQQRLHDAFTRTVCKSIVVGAICRDNIAFLFPLFNKAGNLKLLHPYELFIATPIVLESHNELVIYYALLILSSHCFLVGGYIPFIARFAFLILRYFTSGVACIKMHFV